MAEIFADGTALLGRTWGTLVWQCGGEPWLVWFVAGSLGIFRKPGANV
jgi:hypothetical protein